MAPLRVLFGAVPVALRTSVSEAIGSQTDIEVVGVVSRPTSLLVKAGTLRADIVVVASTDRAPPGITSHLLDQYPHICVAAVTPDGRRVLVYTMRPHVEHIALESPADLIRALRSTDSPGTEDTGNEEDHMAVRIRSLATTGPILVPLSTGTAVRLSPGQVSPVMAPVEVANNAKVEKLRRRGLIELETVEEQDAAADADAPGGESTDQPRAAARAKPNKQTEPSG